MYYYQRTISTSRREEIIDITNIVKDAVKSSGVINGICVVFVPHTTCAVSINEDADPSVKSDVINTLRKLVPHSGSYEHTEGNSDAHIKSTIIGPSLTLIVSNGNIVLGTWQGIYFCEFDGPRQRNIIISLFTDEK